MQIASSTMAFNCRVICVNYLYFRHISSFNPAFLFRWYINAQPVVLFSHISTSPSSKTRIINDDNSPRTSISRSAKYHPSSSNTSHRKPLTGETSRHVLWALRSGKATEERETGHFRETHVLPTNGTRHQIIRVGAAARELGTANCSQSWVNLSEKKF